MTNTTTPATDPVDAALSVLGNLVIGLAAAVLDLACLAVLFPMISAPIAATITVGHLFGMWAGAAVATGSLAVLVAWRLLHPPSFRTLLTDRIRARWLTWLRYRRRWIRVLTACRLIDRDGDRVAYPRLVKVTIGAAVDVVRVRMIPGQSPAEWTGKAAHLAHGFGATHATVTVAGPGLLDIAFRRTDALADPIVVEVDSIAGFRKVTTAADLDAA
ncbi:hypothetical protein [Nocardia thailandica]